MREINCSVVIPVYKGVATLPELMKRLDAVLNTFASHYEAILVNDGSPDASWQTIQELAARYPWVIGINLMRNYGQHNATLCGVRNASYEIIVTMDDDLQHRPEDLPVLFEKLETGFDVVYGVPIKLPKGVFRNWVTKTTKIFLAQVMGLKSVRNISAFRVFRTNLRDAFSDCRNPSSILDVLLSWGTSRFASVSVNIEPAVERSNYGFLKLVRAAILILTGFSTAPLRIASWIGFLMTIFGIGVFIHVVILYYSVGSLPGFPFLAAIISIFGGAQLFALGIFGEYLAHIFNRVMDRPPYSVAEKVGKKS